MTLFDSIQNTLSLDYLKNLVKESVKKLDISILGYDNAITSSNYAKSQWTREKEDDDEYDIEEVLREIDKQYNIGRWLKEIISHLNEIQVIFEKVGITSDSSTPEDINEDSYLEQLEKFQAQCFNLIEDFKRENFVSFVQQLSYITSLSEIHYSKNYEEELKENIEISEETEDKLEETEEYLDSLPEIKTNEVK